MPLLWDAVFLWMLATGTPVTGAATSATRPTKVTSVEGITEYRLDNGLHVLPLRKVSVTDLVALHKHLWGASAAQLSVVGDFDEAAVKGRHWESHRHMEVRRTLQARPATLPCKGSGKEEVTGEVPDPSTL